MRNSERESRVSVFLHLFFLTVAAGYAAFYKVGAGDFWMHLAQGRYIVAKKVIPNSDVFSYTFAGKPWVNWEWLHNVLVSLIWDLSGAVGVEFFRMAVFCLTMVVLYLLLKGLTERPTFSFFLSCLCLLMVQLRIVDRPHILSYLYLVLLLYLLMRSEKASLKSLLLPLALLLVLWRNSHPSWVLGCAVLGTHSLDRGVAFWRAGQMEKIGKMVPWLILLLVLGVFMTPLPLHLSGHLALQSDQSIAEWGSLFSLGKEMWGLEIFLFFLFSLLSLLAVPVAIRERPFYLLLFFLVLGNAYLHFRFIPDAVILGMPLLAMGSVGRDSLFSFRADQRLLAALFLLLTLFVSGTIFREAQFPDRGIGIDDRFVPLHAAEFAKQKNLSGNFYGMYPYSMDFLMGYLYPRVKVALDARVPGLYPFEFANTYWHISTPEQFRERVLSLPLDYVLLGRPALSPESRWEPMLERLLLQEGYDLIYFDSTAALYRAPRATALNDGVTPFRILTRWNTDEATLKRAIAENPDMLLAEVRLLKENTAGKDDFYKEVLIFLYTSPFFPEEQKEVLEKMYASSE